MARGEERRERRFGMLLQREEDLGMRRRKWEKWKKNYVRRGKSYICTYLHTVYGI